MGVNSSRLLEILLKTLQGLCLAVKNPDLLGNFIELSCTAAPQAISPENLTKS